MTGQAHTIEIWYVEQAECVYLLSGNGSRADWVKNVVITAEVSVAVAPSGSQGERSAAASYRATVGPFTEDMHIRQAMAARYQAWHSGQTLSSWAAQSLVVRLRPLRG